MQTKPRPLACLGLLCAALLAACAAPPDAKVPPAKAEAAHHGANALDWAGRYSGRLPCADCEAIATTLQLNADHSYVLQTRYLGKGEGQTFEQRGRFVWNLPDHTILLHDIKSGPDRYRVGEGRLTQLDMRGGPIAGALAERYVLAKEAPPDLLLIAGGREWRLVELMGRPVTPGPDGRMPGLSFKPDGSGQGFAVSGYSGCNQFFGPTELGGAPLRLRFGKLAGTLRACPDMALEQQFLQMLAQVDSYQADARQLQLHRARMAPLARFVPAPP
ncbi:MAG TPA: copper resistance protein NlpE N-terminal domain-containing protein [Roseateles sp.]|nr:copper resistance protein NlpE N-terminal domain-containing protein [Roseateles sp.]